MSGAHQPALDYQGKLRLRRPLMTDEAVMRAAHAEFETESFPFLFRPDLPWGEVLDEVDRDARTEQPPGRVRSDYFVAEVGDIIVGRVSIRHALTPGLLEIGGHVGYGVRPAYRGRGYATTMLRQPIKRLLDLGVGDILVTCDQGNEASRRVIERCGGVLEDVRYLAAEAPGTRRYWITAG
ncbi:MAG: GNAT family N-acetyltransferase [Ornithinimicrobium sp.]